MPVRSIVIPAIFLTVAAVFAGLFMNLSRGERKINLWLFIGYTVVTLLIFGLTALTVMISFDGLLSNYILCQCIFLVLGIVHLVVFSMLSPPGKNEPFWHELIYALYVCLVGLFAFVIVFAHFYGAGLELLFTTSAIFFFVPFLVISTFDFAMAIPAVEYQQWYFPVGQELEMPELDDSKLIVIAFEFFAGANDKKPIRPRTKAPLLMEFGYYFALFITEYNSADAENQVEFMDVYGSQPVGWNFYIQTRWWQPRKYIDPAATVLENGIKEDDLIIAERV